MDVFLPLMGSDCLAVHAYFKRIEYSNPKLVHSVRIIAKATGIDDSTVCRSLEILEYLGLIKLTRFRGSKESECQLRDSREAANRLGAIYNARSVSFSLPPEVEKRLKAEVASIRERQQGKSTPKAARGAPQACGNLPFSVSHRSAGVSPEKRQRPTGETQTCSHLIQEERRIEEGPTPTPTPSDSGEAQKDKDSPDEDEPDPLRWATIVFTGVMNDLGDHLFDTSRPPNPRFANGADDWAKFGFNSLAVEAAEWHGERLTLILSASDPAAALRGLEKYRRKWDESLRKWYQCEVRVTLVEDRRER